VLYDNSLTKIYILSATHSSTVLSEDQTVLTTSLFIYKLEGFCTIL